MSHLVAPRGTVDVLPPESVRWQRLEARLRALALRFGYGEIRTPMFESTDLFVRGVGEATDIVEKEMYTFVDKGGRSVTLRPEWTAPVVRALLQEKALGQEPQRLFYAGPIFRYERPQKGRLRQAHQFGVECFGFAGPEADAEVIALAFEALRAHQVDDAVLRLNSIGDEVCRPRYREALLQYFRPRADLLSDDSRRRLETNPLRILDSKAEADRELVEGAPTMLDVLCDDCRAHFARLQQYLSELEIPYTIDPRIVRGLDYYTRTVFEITSPALGAQSTVIGGGRYDGLVRSLGGPDVPGVGFAMGLERFLMMLAARGEAGAPRSGVQVIALDEPARARLVPLIGALRRAGDFPVNADYAIRKVTAQFKIADRNDARLAIIAGSDELASGELTVRDLETRTQDRVPFRAPGATAQQLVAWYRDRVGTPVTHQSPPARVTCAPSMERQ
jgi:histidyl-tRNA synthetase